MLKTSRRPSPRARALWKRPNKAMAGDKYEIGTETFSKGEGKDKVDYVMVVVTCKAVASTETVG